MSLPNLLLGLLEKPMSGYDLKKEFEAGLAHIWFVNLSQIYPTLKKMSADGWVTHETLAPEHGPSRKIYTRTDMGRTKLLSWIKAGPTVSSQRLNHIAQSYFLYELEDDSSAIIFFEHLLSHLNKWKGTMEVINKHWRGNSGEVFFDQMPPEDFYPYLTLDLGLRSNASDIEWCKSCIRRVKRKVNNSG